MKKLILILTCTLWATAMLAAVSVIPLPNKCIERKGNFCVNEKTIISLSTDNEEMRNAVAVLNERFEKAAGFRLGVSASTRTSNVIRCLINPKMKAEAYTLSVSPKMVKITSGSAKGVFYAMQTLRQLLPAAIENDSRANGNNAWNISCVEIEDAPTFGYRGVMLDVSRHFIPKEDIKRHIDMLAFHKLNILHWHLTDDQGWRIEIKKYPKLTSVGGFRKKTICGFMWDNPSEWDTHRYGGFYTQENVKEIVAYAQQRFVEIIPEIEMPGHSVAALTAYPEFSCSGGPFEVEGRWGVFNDIYCTKEATFTFLQDILDEVIQLFPSRYIHLGGDEAPRIRWKNCVHCQQRMQKEQLTKEAELQTYFMNRIERYLNGKGKSIIGWDEILEGGIPQRATVMSWRGEKGGIAAAKAGYDVIMSPNVYTYFNCYQQKPQGRKVGNPKRVISLEKVYNYHPVPDVLSAEEGRHIIGIQANLWTEYITTLGDMEYMLYPRVAALAEVGWSKKEHKDYTRFCSRLSQLSQHYDIMGVDYCKDR